MEKSWYFGNKPGTCVCEIGVGEAGQADSHSAHHSGKHWKLYIKIKYLHTIKCAFNRSEGQTAVWENSLALKTLMCTIYSDRLQIRQKENGETGEALGRDLRNTGVAKKCWSHCQWCLVIRPHHVAGKPQLWLTIHGHTWVFFSVPEET